MTVPGAALRLDLGCGNAKRDGFIGLDLFSGPEVDLVLDLTSDRFPFDDDSVEEVFSAHFLEHIESPNHVFAEIGRVCKDGAHIEFWTPYAFTNDAFLYGHVHGITEELWIHVCVSHRDAYLPMLGGRWQLDRLIFVVRDEVVRDLQRNGVDLDFAIRYLKGVVHEFGVEMTYRRNLDVGPGVPERVSAATRFGARTALVAGAPISLGTSVGDRVLRKASALKQRVGTMRKGR